jgi:hypothetical protein
MESLLLSHFYREKAEEKGEKYAGYLLPSHVSPLPSYFLLSFFICFAQESRSAIVRLITSLSGVESLSTQK